MSARSPLGPDGAEWSTARKADVAAVRAGRKPDKLAKLIGERPHRYAAWVARETVAVQDVTDWNRSAHEEVTRETRKRLVGEEASLRAQIMEHAAAAFSAAEGSGMAADDARLRAAWKPVSAMDAAADAWRPVYAL